MIGKLRYNYILWDADDTLLDFGAAENYGFEMTMGEFNLPHDSVHHRIYNEINEKLWQDFNRGLIKKEILLVERFREYLKAVGQDASPEELNAAYLGNLSRCSALIDGALDTVKMLDDMGVRQYIVTNAVSFVNRRRVGNSPLAPYFRDIFVSEDVGHAKPEKEYFDYVLEHICADDLRRVIIVGDSLSSDIQGGINAGLDTCLFNPRHKVSVSPKADYEIDRLPDIVRIVSGHDLEV